MSDITTTAVARNPLDRPMRDLIVDSYLLELDALHFTAEEAALDSHPVPQGRPLRFSSQKLFAYAERYCGGGNSCPDPDFDNDCTHFMCHAIKAAGLRVSRPTAVCKSGLCIRVGDLAVTFDSAAKLHPNVHKFDYSQARRGDFCFVPKWFHLRKEHVMLLAGPLGPAGAPVFAHTNNRCGQPVDFDTKDCVYYRIDDA
jgi:hypothetical protein